MYGTGYEPGINDIDTRTVRSPAPKRSRCTRKLSSIKESFLLRAQSPCLQACITKGCLIYVAGHEPAPEDVSAGALQSPAPKRSRRTRKLSDVNEAAAAVAEEDFQVRSFSCIVIRLHDTCPSQDLCLRLRPRIGQRKCPSCLCIHTADRNAAVQ